MTGNNVEFYVIYNLEKIWKKQLRTPLLGGFNRLMQKKCFFLLDFTIIYILCYKETKLAILFVILFIIIFKLTFAIVYIIIIIFLFL